MQEKLTLFKSKIHRAIVTDADLHYEGSVTISGELMDAANILEYEQVHIWDITNGQRLVTYAIRGPQDTGSICINGAGAHLMKKGDLVILATFVQLPAHNATQHSPIVVQVDEKNRIIKPLQNALVKG